MKCYLLAVVPVVLISHARLASAPRRTVEHPPYLRLSLAGFHVGQAQKLYDPKERYFLIGDGDCDTSHLRLSLIPEGEDEERDAERKKKYKRVSLQRLRTGTGVNIGDAPFQIQRKLGKAPDYSSYDRIYKQRAYVYRATLFKPNRDGKTKEVLYTGEYTFRNEKLYSISYHLNEAESC